MKSYGMDVTRRQYRIPDPLNDRLDELADETPLNKSQIVRIGIQLALEKCEDPKLQDGLPSRWGQERYLAEELDINADFI